MANFVLLTSVPSLRRVVGSKVLVTYQTLASVFCFGGFPASSSATVLSSLIDWEGGDESELDGRERVTYSPKSDSHINHSFCNVKS